MRALRFFPKLNNNNNNKHVVFNSIFLLFFSIPKITSQTPTPKISHTSDLIGGLRLTDRVPTITTGHNPTISDELLNGAIAADTYQTLMAS
jgi:hypothetical protein